MTIKMSRVNIYTKASIKSNKCKYSFCLSLFILNATIDFLVVSTKLSSSVVIQY